MESISDTIVALSSGNIKSAISLIRVSGSDSFTIVDSIFSNTKEHKHANVYHGYIIDNNETVDEVMVSYFLSPKSFTGENMVEITCHGNMYIVESIIELLIKKGARLATKGEFSKRAFMFGKLDLVEAEAINDLINATSRQAYKLAKNSMEGHTTNMVKSLQSDLLDIIGQIDVNIDYPEYDDIEQLRYDSVLPAIEKFIEQIEKTISDTKKGQTIKDGIDTVIIGKPNVGKSSLLNSILREDKAIVTDIAGTTRDIVEGKIDFNGLTLNLIDTAGIHDSIDVVEKVGIEKSLKALDKASLVILLLDGSKPLDENDNKLLELSKNLVRIIAINKTDKNQCFDIDGACHISCNNNDLSELENKISIMFKHLEYNNEPLLFNARQLGLLNAAKDSLISAKNEALNGQVIDIISIDLKEAYSKIGEILGNGDMESLLDNIFSRFCLGK